MILKITQDGFFDRTKKYLVQKLYTEGGYAPFYICKSLRRGESNWSFCH